MAFQLISEVGMYTMAVEVLAAQIIMLVVALSLLVETEVVDQGVDMRLRLVELRG
jgi:hypothetical protein